MGLFDWLTRPQPRPTGLEALERFKVSLTQGLERNLAREGQALAALGIPVPQCRAPLEFHSEVHEPGVPGWFIALPRFLYPCHAFCPFIPGPAQPESVLVGRRRPWA